MIDAFPLAIYSYYATDSLVYNSNQELYNNFQKVELDI